MALIQQPQPATVPAQGPAPRFNMAYVWAITLVAAMGGLLFGYDWVVIGGAKVFYEKYFDLTEAALGRLRAARMSGWVNSCALLGCLLGSAASGALSDRFGRKRLLVASALLFAVSSILTGAATGLRAFVGWRIVGGVAIGMASNLSPMYIAEVAPAAMRGRLVAANQLTIVIGILAAQIVNWLISRHAPDGATAEFIRQSWYGQMGWRWMFYAVTVPSALFFVLALLVPESPRWLVKNGRDGLARQVLARIGGAAHAERELGLIKASLAGSAVGRVRFGELLEPRLMRLLLLGVGLAVLQQWCGINVIFNYAEEIFSQAGYGVSGIFFQIVVTGAVNLVFTLIAMAMVDRFGRRGLLLGGCIGLAATHGLIGLAYFQGRQGLAVVVPVMASMACYALSLAPIVWVVIAEIFPNRIRGAAVSVAVIALWLACFVLTLTFPVLNATLGAAGTFWVYAGICALGALFVALKLPETKGKSLEQIERELIG